ncbi:hypothetical protein FF38_09037 [Lucilia cuprina]|uniref:Uncharacterized protein n=1 Tax=Lucilia cuprina TaxID=7375 RepID=A0A0L0C1A3_LUCCU|nr:hypothetical protein FF38_09037 [Lucilia cuprina]
MEKECPSALHEDLLLTALLVFLSDAVLSQLLMPLLFSPGASYLGEISTVVLLQSRGICYIWPLQNNQLHSGNNNKYRMSLLGDSPPFVLSPGFCRDYKLSNVSSALPWNDLACGLTRAPDNLVIRVTSCSTCHGWSIAAYAGFLNPIGISYRRRVIFMIMEMELMRKLMKDWERWSPSGISGILISIVLGFVFPSIDFIPVIAFSFSGLHFARAYAVCHSATGILWQRLDSSSTSA